MKKNDYIPNIAMSIHAHPDDQEFTVSGTLAYWIKKDTKVISVCVTSGEAGSNESLSNEISGDSLSRIRENEQTAANQILGIQETVFLRYPDGILEPTMKLRKDITRTIRKFKPDTLITSDPQEVFYGNGYINHPDHRAAAQAALYAAFPSTETRFIFPELLYEGFLPHKVNRLFIHGADKPDTWIDITSTIDMKINALRKHVSQLGKWDPEKMILDWAREEAKGHWVRYVETYKVMYLHEPDD